MNKKIISLLLAAATALSFGTVNAKDKTYEYGSLLKSATFEGNTASYITFHNNGGFKASYSYDEKHNGKRSYYIDTKSPTTDTKQLTLQFNVESSLLKGYEDCNILFEGYTKRDNTTDKPSGFSFWYYKGSQIIKNVAPTVEDESDENGWYRFYFMAKPRSVEGTDSIVINYHYSYNATDGLAKVYFDDLSARVLPLTLEAFDLSTNKKVMPLTQSVLYGYDAQGEKERIHLTDLPVYTVVSGSAHIDKNGNLVYTGTKNGTVTIEADFFGLKDRFDVAFDIGVYASAISKNENTYSVSIENSTAKSVSATLCVALYDGDRLSNVKTQSVVITGGSSGSVSCVAPEIPFYVKNPVIRAYLIN